MRKLAVEPFLLLLEEYGVVPHPKQLPLNRMMHAFLDWVGIEQRRRPTDAGIRTIARDLQKQGQRGSVAQLSKKQRQAFVYSGSINGHHEMESPARFGRRGFL